MRTSRLLPIALAASAFLLLSACSRVKDDWKAAQGADTSEAYQDFLQQYPDSEFAVQAQARLKQLAEDRDWQQASSADTLEAYEQFVAQHADSKWAQEARIRIENFNLAAGGQAAAPAPAEGAAAAPGVRGATAGTASPNIVATTPPPAAAKPAPAPQLARPVAAGPAVAKPASAPAAAPVAAGSHLVQLGAFSTRARAEADWRSLQAKYASDLRGLKPHYAAGRSQGKPVVRLQVGLASEQRADALCASLKKHGQACVAVR